jgi:hypothetical protein
MTDSVVWLDPIARAVAMADQGSTAHARLNWGRWIADCASPWCTSALQLDPGMTAMRCWDCGWETTHIAWPDDPDAIAWVLALRPDEKNRNYEPGETLDVLVAENVAHGIAMPMDEHDVLLRTANGKAVGGGLVHELESAGRRIDWARAHQIGD